VNLVPFVVTAFLFVTFNSLDPHRKYRVWIRLDDYNDHYDLIGDEADVSAPNWTVAEAKAKFSEIIERALAEGPQTITKRGRTAAIVVGAEEWERKTKRAGNLAEFFAASPLRESGLTVRRRKTQPHKINL
jgi:prevent-host-death family protein